MSTTASRAILLVLLTVLALALALRLAGAGGDLSQDEITSLKLVSHITHADQVFWDINTDNNHILNSLWLFLLGHDASTLARRSLSIALGVATVAAGGWWSRRRGGTAAMLLAMALLATSPMMVEFGSEARGYSGLLLMTILSAGFLEDELTGKQKRKLPLALTILAGYLFHYDMCLVVAALGLGSGLWLWQRDGSVSKSLRRSLRIFTLPLLLLVAAMSPLVIFHAEPDGFVPFHFSGLARAFSQSVVYTIPLLGAFALLGVIFVAGLDRDSPRRFMYPAIILGPVGLIALGHFPNFSYPRHFITADAFLLLLIAEGCGKLWQKGKAWRGMILCACALILAGNAVALRDFFRDERGHYSAAVATMALHGPSTYTVINPEDAPVRLVDMVRFFDAQKVLTYVPHRTACARSPDWVLSSDSEPDPDPPANFTLAETGCTLTYSFAQRFPYAGLTGVEWTLYRRQ